MFEIPCGYALADVAASCVLFFLLLVLFVSVVVVGCGFYGITNLNLFFGICTRSSFDYTLGECIGEHPPLEIGGGTDQMQCK